MDFILPEQTKSQREYSELRKTQERMLGSAGDLGSNFTFQLLATKQTAETLGASASSLCRKWRLAGFLAAIAGLQCQKRVPDKQGRAALVVGYPSSSLQLFLLNNNSP